MSNRTGIALCSLLLANLVLHLVWYFCDLPRWNISVVNVVWNGDVSTGLRQCAFIASLVASAAMPVLATWLLYEYTRREPSE